MGLIVGCRGPGVGRGVWEEGCEGYVWDLLDFCRVEGVAQVCGRVGPGECEVEGWNEGGEN